MKIKKFESFNDKPEIGDYVIANNLDYVHFDSDVDDYLRSAIGKINDIHGVIISIKYDNIPIEFLKKFKNNITNIHVHYTTYAKTIEELELKNQSQIYNI